jgi:biopolymer transport protein ExbD
MKQSRFSQAPALQGINVSPLIDMVFILLIFFIVAAVFVEEPGVEVRKPSTITAEKLEKDSILLALTDTDDIYYGGENIGIDGVRPLIRRLLRTKDMPVILQVDRDADGQTLVRLIEEARLSGGKVSVASKLP